MKRRVKGFGACCYHISSRINEDRAYLGEKEKQVFLDLLYRCADFCGVELVTFCIMDDHFHLLVHIPAKGNVNDKELLRRLRVLYGEAQFAVLLDEYHSCQKAASTASLDHFRERYLRRMWDLSEFVSTLKQRFSIWYNLRNDRCGPLWSGRFRSVLIQSSPDARGAKALSIIAAYIDLNSVRAGMVNDPKDYVWSGYGRAVAEGGATAGIDFMFNRNRRIPIARKRALAIYGVMLASLCEGREPASRQVEALCSVETILRNQCQCLSRGWIFGDKAFVEFITHRRPECFPAYRRDNAVPVDGAMMKWFTAFHESRRMV